MTWRKITVGLVLLSCCISLQSAAAEIYKCDGKWTNKPCSDGAKPVTDLPGLSKYSQDLADTAAPTNPDPNLDPYQPYDAEPQGETKKLTRLRVVGNPEGQWLRSGNRIRLSSVQVTLKNVGTVTADGIRVSVDVPGGGGTVSLSGPDSIPKHQTGVYTASPDRYVSIQSSLRANIICSNCRR